MIIGNPFQGRPRGFMVIHADRITHHQDTRKIGIICLARIFKRSYLHLMNHKMPIHLLTLDRYLPKPLF